MRAYVDGLLRYFEISGRSSRAQYWLFQLFFLLACIAAVFIDLWRGERFEDHLPPITVFAVIFHYIPLVTVSVRRLHDIGKSGWWYLVSLLPFGTFVLIAWHLKPSEPGPNDYGDDPHETPRGDPAPIAPSLPTRVQIVSRPVSVAARQVLAGTQPRTFGQRGLR